MKKEIKQDISYSEPILNDVSASGNGADNNITVNKKLVAALIILLAAASLAAVIFLMKGGQKNLAASSREEKSGDAAAAKGDFTRAAEFYKNALNSDSENSNTMKKFAYTKAAEIQYDYKKDLSDEALAAVNRAIELKPNDSESYRIKGYIEEVGLDCKAAIESYKTAVELDAGNEAAYSGLGHCYSYLGDEKNAVDAYAKAYELAPNDGYINLAYATQAYVRNGEYDKALPYLEKAIKNLTDKRLKAEALTLRGEIAVQQEESLDKIVSYFDQAIKTDETYSRAYVGKVKNIFSSITEAKKPSDTDAAKIKECFSLLYQANKINPLDASVSYWEGFLLRLGSENESAEAVLRDGLNRASKDVTLWTPADKNKLMGSIYYELAAIYSTTDKTDTAIINLKKSLVLNPSLALEMTKAYESPFYFQKIKARPDFNEIKQEFSRILVNTARERY